MILQLKFFFFFFYLEERDKEGKRNVLEIQNHLFSDSVCLPHFTNEEFEAQGRELLLQG